MFGLGFNLHSWKIFILKQSITMVKPRKVGTSTYITSSKCIFFNNVSHISLYNIFVERLNRCGGLTLVQHRVSLKSSKKYVPGFASFYPNGWENLSVSHEPESSRCWHILFHQSISTLAHRQALQYLFKKCQGAPLVRGMSRTNTNGPLIWRMNMTGAALWLTFRWMPRKLSSSLKNSKRNFSLTSQLEVWYWCHLFSMYADCSFILLKLLTFNAAT